MPALKIRPLISRQCVCLQDAAATSKPIPPTSGRYAWLKDKALGVEAM
jgi:hypothetical protein